MAKTNEEDTTEIADETLTEEAADALEPEEIISDEVIIPDEEGKPTIVRKKVAALKARHRLEDYFEMKRIQDELDYLDDEKKRKAALLLKVTQEENLDKLVKHEKPEKHENPVKEAKKEIIKEVIIETKKEVKTDIVKQAKPAKAKSPPKPKAKSKPKAKPKAKPKHKPVKKARKKDKK